jgi:2,4-dienoyl-CoA reductase-like NADH-dependent reductase (Old Yellow Enzyme family)
MVSTPLSPPQSRKAHRTLILPLPPDGCKEGGRNTFRESGIPVAKGYPVPLARKIRDEAEIMTGAVGLITEPHHADKIMTGGDADLVFLARELLREPYWALKGQQELGAEPAWPTQYGYAVKRRAK